jgi:hypothetical protein
MHNTEQMVRSLVRQEKLRVAVQMVARTKKEQSFDFPEGTVHVYYFDLMGEPGYEPEVVIYVDTHDMCKCGCEKYRKTTYTVLAKNYQ